MSECKSCAGCKFLYGKGFGYSNYTWENTIAMCALGKADFEKIASDSGKYKGYNVPGDIPCDWNRDPENDNWFVTASSRCERYSLGEEITIDVDCDGEPSTPYGSGKQCPWVPYPFCDDEQYQAIMESEGWEVRLPLSTYMLGGKPIKGTIPNPTKALDAPKEDGE